MKIVSSGSALHSPEFHEKLKSRKKLRWSIAISILMVLIGGSIYLGRLNKLLISEINVEGSSVVKADEISGAAAAVLSGKYLGIIPRSNSLIYPGDKLEETILRDFPRVKTVSAVTLGHNTLKLYVEERNPFALYCKDLGNIGDPIGCYFLDETGYIFDTAPAFSGVVYFIYTEDEPLENPQSRQFLTPEAFEELGIFINDVKHLGLEPLAFKTVGGEYHLFLRNKGVIKWQASDDLRVIYSNLEAFLKSDEISQDTNFISKIEYLDLRTENKVFYKLQ